MIDFSPLSIQNLCIYSGFYSVLLVLDNTRNCGLKKDGYIIGYNEEDVFHWVLFCFIVTKKK